MHLLRLAQRKLGIRPADRSRGVNTIAWFELRDGIANLLDHARAIVARRVR